MISNEHRAAAAQQTDQEVGMDAGTLPHLSGPRDPPAGLLKRRLTGPARGPEHPHCLQDPSSGDAL